MKKIKNFGKIIEDNIMLILAGVAFIFFCIETLILKDVLMAIAFNTMVWCLLILHNLYRIERKIDKNNVVVAYDSNNPIVAWENMKI